MQNLDTSAIEHSQLPCWFFGNSIGVSEEFMPNQHIPLKTCSPCTTALTWPIASCGRLAFVMSSRSAVHSCSYNFQRRLSERWMVGMLSLLIRLQPWRCNKTRVAAIQPHRPTHTHTRKYLAVTGQSVTVNHLRYAVAQCHPWTNPFTQMNDTLLLIGRFKATVSDKVNSRIPPLSKVLFTEISSF